METGESRANILVAIGNRILCESLCRMLSHQQSKYSCFSHFQANPPPPDLVLFDSSKALEQLQNEYPEAKFILMNNGLKEQDVSYLLLYHQLSGVIPPDTSMALFLKALNVVHSGQIWIDNKHLKALLHRNGATSNRGSIHTLSQQDKKIVKLVTQGLKNRDIAEQLFLSEHTIKAHLSRIFKTLSINRRTQLASLVLENGPSTEQ